MLRVDHVCKRYGDSCILDNVSFTIGPSEKMGLIGPNGCGKSTLARIIAGLEEPDSGSVSGDFRRQGARYLPQGSLPTGGWRAWQALPSQGTLWRLGKTVSDDTTRLPRETLALLDAFEAAGGWQAYGRLEEALRTLRIDGIDPQEPYAQLSGGERTKLALADVLLRPGRFLLLDEPSNHLDLDALLWLEHFLSSYSGALLLVSHDRTLIDAVVDSVIALDPVSHGARRYAGGYSAYQAEQEREYQQLTDAYRRQQERIDRVEADLRRVKQRALRFDATSQSDYHRRIGKKVARTAKVRERKLEKLLQSEQHIEKPITCWTLKADFSEAHRSGDIVLEARDVTLSLGGRLLFDRLSLLVRQGERVVLTGPNGSGKTTLLRVLIGERQPNAGRVRLGVSVAAGYLSQQQEGIDLRRTPLQEIRSAATLDEAAARGYLHRFLFSGDEVNTRNDCLSFGQRSRLALARIIVSGVNVLVVDEPLNHLDIPSRERFEQALDSFQGTILAVSHDRAFIERFGRRVLRLRDGQLQEVEFERLRDTPEA